MTNDAMFRSAMHVLPWLGGVRWLLPPFNPRSKSLLYPSHRAPLGMAIEEIALGVVASAVKREDESCKWTSENT
jgi:hypothetical protein